MRNRMIRIFVSSTFQDFKEERDLLAEYVFPELEKKCRENGFSFQAVDLRWGISQQNSLDNQTLKICIDEIARCRKLSPRPNFLIISGRRYGWIPLPCSIPMKEWDLLVEHLPEESENKRILSRWYRQDLNDLKKEYLLQPRLGEYLSEEKWNAEEEKLKRTLFALAKERLPEDSLVRYGLSATEQEIYHGLFWADDQCDHKLIVLMEGEEEELRKGIQEKKLTERDLAETKRLQNHLKDFSSKERKPYRIMYDPKKPFPLEKIRDHFIKIIEEEIENVKQMTPYEQECAVVSSELQHVKENYIDAAENGDGFQTFLEVNRGKSILVTGESGSGKSTMLKYWYGEHEELSAAVFADIQPGCRNVLYAVWFISMELKRKGYLKETEPMPEMENCVEWFERQLNQTAGGRTVTVILDSVNYMDNWNKVKGSFFQMKLPPNVTLIVSCFSKESLSDLEQRMDIPAYPMKLLEKQSGLYMLRAKLEASGRCLNFEKSTRDEWMPAKATPLYIQLLSDICRRIHSYDVPEVLPKAGNAQELIRLLVRKQSAGTYQILYYHILGYIALAEEGLSEQELLEILSADQEVCAEIKSQTEWEFKGKIPSVLWVRILVEIQDFLMEAESNGILLYRFRHMLIHQEIKKMIGNEKLKILASNLKEYFRKQDLTWKGQGNALVLNKRKLREYYAVLSYLEQWEELGLLLEDPIYSDCLIRMGWYRELLMQFRSLEHHMQLNTAQIRILKALQQRPILLQTWNDSFRQILYSEGIIGDPDLLREAGKSCVLIDKNKSVEESGSLETMFIAESASKSMALRDDRIAAILVNGNVQIIDWKLRTLLQAACQIGTDYMILYWKGSELVARGEYCRAVLHFNGKELYVVRQESCPGFVGLMRKEGAESVIEKAGGPRETDVVFSETKRTFSYFCGRTLRKTEVFYPYKTAFSVYLLGYLAAVLVDYRHVEIVDLNRRVVLHAWDLPAVSRIYWSESGREILVSLLDNRIMILPVDAASAGTPMAGPGGDYAFAGERKNYGLFFEEYQNTIDHIVRPTWKGYKPILARADEHLPILAAFSARKRWIAYYYNRHNHAIVRLFRLDTEELIATEYVDPIFTKDTVRPAFYAADGGKKLVLVSAGKHHEWDIDSLEWRHIPNNREEYAYGSEIPDRVKDLLQEYYPAVMKKWYPLKTARNRFMYRKSVTAHLMDALISVLMLYVKILFWYIKLDRPGDDSEILREQLSQLPVYNAEDFFVVPNAEMGLIHICDRNGVWICHEQLEKPFWAIDIVGNDIYILMKDSDSPIVKEIKSEILPGGKNYD